MVRKVIMGNPPITKCFCFLLTHKKGDFSYDVILSDDFSWNMLFNLVACLYTRELNFLIYPVLKDATD